jgi:hypothetical protein
MDSTSLGMNAETFFCSSNISLPFVSWSFVRKSCLFVCFASGVMSAFDYDEHDYKDGNEFFVS